MSVSDTTSKKRDMTEGLNRSHGSFELVVSPVLLGLLGWWLDSKLDTTPAFVVGLAVFGVVGAAVKQYYTYKLQMQQTREVQLVASAEKAARNAEARDVRLAERAELERTLAAHLEDAEQRETELV